MEEQRMTQQEALKELENLTIDYSMRTAEEIERLDEAVDMAIAALREDAVDRPTCDDAVSRQQAIDAIKSRKTAEQSSAGIMRNAVVDFCIDIVKKLPSAQPLVIHCTDCEDWLERQSTLGFTISELPAAQPQITRCAECIHWKHSDVRKNYCEVFDWMNTADDFCSFAERRSDE